MTLSRHGSVFVFDSSVYPSYIMSIPFLTFYSFSFFFTTEEYIISLAPNQLFQCGVVGDSSLRRLLWLPAVSSTHRHMRVLGIIPSARFIGPFPSPRGMKPSLSGSRIFPLMNAASALPGSETSPYSYRGCSE